jgi:hypothetical protein
MPSKVHGSDLSVDLLSLQSSSKAEMVFSSVARIIPILVQEALLSCCFHSVYPTSFAQR